MPPFHFILLTHIGLASTSVSLFLLRAIYLWVYPKKPLFSNLKKITIGVDSLLTLTGITQIIYLNYQPLSQYRFWAKMSLLIIYILTLRAHQSVYRRIGFLCIALSAAALIALIATRKTFLI
jgi:uncharacterized membrane protein SirB2